MGTLAGWRCGTLSSPSPLALETSVYRRLQIPLFALSQNVCIVSLWPHLPLQWDFSDRYQLWQMGP